MYDRPECKTEARRVADATAQGRPVQPRPAPPRARPREHYRDSGARRLYTELQRAGVTEVTTAQAADILGLSRRGVDKSLRELEAHRLLERIVNGRYKVLLPSTPEASRLLGY